MALNIIGNHVQNTYRKSVISIVSILNEVSASTSCLSTRIVQHYSTFKKHPHVSKTGATCGQMFELCVTEALSVMGVDSSRQKLHVKHGHTNVEVDVFVVGAKRSIIILLKASLRERWKQEDRDAMTIKSNAKGCADSLYEQAGIGKFDSAYPPIVWALTFKEKDATTPEQAIEHARNIGKMCTGVDTGRFVSVFDKERMNFLVSECKESQ